MNNGNTHITDRVVSVHDPDARPIQKGKLKSPTEFGYKTEITENEDRIITDYKAHVGNPSDESLLLDTVKRHIYKTGKVPYAMKLIEVIAATKTDENLLLWESNKFLFLRRVRKARNRQLRKSKDGLGIYKPGELEVKAWMLFFPTWALAVSTPTLTPWGSCPVACQFRGKLEWNRLPQFVSTVGGIMVGIVQMYDKLSYSPYDSLSYKK